MIKLSKQQIKDADRVGGIELMILWPASLGAEPTDIARDQDREASAAEKRSAEVLLEQACQSAALVPVRVRVACIRRPTTLPVAGGQERVHLAVILIGRRWVHASTKKQPRVAFAAVA